MKYAVDKIIDNIIVLENIDTKEKLEVSVNDLPNKIKEGNIVKFINNKFVIDKEEENLRRKIILEKLHNLQNLD